MKTVRCNCDASCGENRYHDVGDSECRFRDVGEYQAYYRFEKTKPVVQEKSVVNITDKDEIERLRGALKTIGGIINTHGTGSPSLTADLVKTVVDETLLGIWPAYGIIPKSAKEYKPE